MADITNLERFLTDVADSIRVKRNIDGTIAAESFDDEIDNIVTGTVVDKVVAEASKIIEDETVVKIETEPVEQPIVLPENGVAEVLADKTVLAESIGLTPDKVAKGASILGIDGEAQSGVMSQEEYDICNDLAAQTLGNTPLIDI